MTQKSADRPTCIAGSSKRSGSPRPCQPNVRGFATHAVSSPVLPGGYQRSNLPSDGPQLLSAPEAGAFLVSHPLQDGTSALARVVVASLVTGRH